MRRRAIDSARTAERRARRPGAPRERARKYSTECGRCAHRAWAWASGVERGARGRAWERSDKWRLSSHTRARIRASLARADALRIEFRRANACRRITRALQTRSSDERSQRASDSAP